MTSTRHIMALCAAGLICAGSTATAQDMQAGESEYMIACAVCHGESGKGAGPMTEYLSIEVPSLTTLAADNDGTFPYLEVFQVIDGRTGVRGHGGAMPVWGDRFSTGARGEYGPFGAEVVTRGRIAVLTDYLMSIQE
ncbi:MAG: c-type cytochrome [Paracoccaceae bacterium]|jgi:mono/diheme cytochrome c family protein|nr:c-type cytochrome [Paracoccaceae bacterium]